jgi:hypothetical protein
MYIGGIWLAAYGLSRLVQCNSLVFGSPHNRIANLWPCKRHCTNCIVRNANQLCFRLCRLGGAHARERVTAADPTPVAELTYRGCGPGAAVHDDPPADLETTAKMVGARGGGGGGGLSLRRGRRSTKSSPAWLAVAGRDEMGEHHARSGMTPPHPPPLLLTRRRAPPTGFLPPTIAEQAAATPDSSLPYVCATTNSAVAPIPT